MRYFAALTAVVLALVGLSAPAHAAPKPTKYKDCVALNKVYPYGVAVTAEAAAAMAGARHYRPATNRKVYNLNVRLDAAPKNGTVCEVALPVAAPSAVQGLRVISTGTDRIDLGWQPPADDGGAPITSYVVSGSGGTATVVGTNAIVTGLTAGTAYTFAIVAVNSAGQSAPSTVAATTQAAPTPAATQAPSGAPYFRTCADAKAAGYAPLRRGTAVYDRNTHLDRDKDGIACE